MPEEVVSLSVEGMSCDHCVKTIKTAVESLNGVAEVTISLEDKKVVVEFDNERISADTIKDVIEDQGYNVR